MIMEAIMRGWENFVARPGGPLDLRFFLQPTIAIIMALRAGVHDAKEGRPPYLWSIFTNPSTSRNLLRDGWKDMGTTFVIAMILDSIYQLATHQGIYLLEVLVTATLLALIPYLILRGPFNLIARLFIGNKSAHKKNTFDNPKQTKEIIMSENKPEKKDWSKPAAMAIPKGGYIKKEEGRYGQIYPKTPACYGFTIIAKIKPGKEEIIREYGNTIEKTIGDLPEALDVLKLHYLRWVLFDIKGDTYFMYQGIFDTDFDKYTEDAVALFSKYGINTVFENLEDFPADWKTNTPAFIKFVREHQCPSFLEYGEYPYVSADEIKKALRLKKAFSDMLDLMQ